MTVRPPRPAEAPTLRALQATLPEPAPELLDAALGGGPADVLVVTTPDADAPVGYALLVPGEAVYLAELAVAPAHRGEGHGSALLSAVSERGGEVRTVARSADERALSFYRRHGFAVVERLPDRFEGGDGLLLRRA
jgi:ribosomal-protein-alanine N-acetyltransferase